MLFRFQENERRPIFTTQSAKGRAGAARCDATVALETFYKATHNACRYALRLPSPRLIQELVQAWRALRRKSQRPCLFWNRRSQGELIDVAKEDF
jgi:hypothetical protein